MIGKMVIKQNFPKCPYILFYQMVSAKGLGLGLFQFLIGVKKNMSKESAFILAICPLQSLIQDQTAEAKSLGLTANSLPEALLEDVEAGKFQMLFLSVENVQ